MIRKLQKTSANTYFVALPKDWIQGQQLFPSDELTVAESTRGNFLLVYPTNPLNPTQVHQIIKESPNLSRDILAAYLGGADIIQVVPAEGRSELEQAQFVRDQRQLLSGLEITRDLPTLIQLEFFFPLEQLKPGQYLEKCFDMAIWMTRDFLKALDTNDTVLAESVASRDAEVNRTYFLLVRMLRTFVGDPTQRAPLSPTECLDFRMVAAFAEEIGDKVAQLCNLFTENTWKEVPGNIQSKIKKLIEQILGSTQQLIKAFINHDEAKAVELKQDVQEQRNALVRLQKNVSPLLEGRDLLRAIVDFQGRFLDILDDIADLSP
ncbi:MAG: PhoU domain-containing protein [Candidatus Hodarchaeales archaeon]